MIFVIGGIIFLIVIICIYFFAVSKKKLGVPSTIISSVKDVEDIGELSLEIVMKFFKQPSVMEILKKDQDCLAVLLKDIDSKDTIRIVACVFNKKTNQVIEDYLYGWRPAKLDPMLTKAFGDKSMILMS